MKLVVSKPFYYAINVLIALLFLTTTVSAQRTTSSTGNWSATGTWTAANTNRTGTVTSATNSTTVTGSGTSFTTELSVGSMIGTQGATAIGTVASITSNTSLTLTGNASNAVSAQSYRTTGGVPSPNDAVTITSTHNVTVNGTFTCASLNIGDGGNSTAQITFSGTNPQLTVTGNINVGQTSGGNNRTGRITFTSDATLTAGTLVLFQNTTSSIVCSIIMTSGGTLKTGSFSLGTGSTAPTWTPGTGTVELTATNTLPASTFTSFNNLNITGGTTSLGAALSIDTLNISNGVTITPGSNLVTLSGDLVNNGTVTSGSGGLTISGTATQLVGVFLLDVRKQTLDNRR